MNLLSSRGPAQEINRSFELELEFISCNIRKLKSMVHIAVYIIYIYIYIYQYIYLGVVHINEFIKIKLC